MNLSDSERKVFDEILRKSGFTSDGDGWENYLEVYDDNFSKMQKDVNDSIGAVLTNAALAIAEQKKLLQSAKNPTALTQAIKMIAITSGNLLNAGATMLSWMGKQLPKRDSIFDDALNFSDADIDNYGLRFLSWLSGNLPKRDSSLRSDEGETMLVCKDSSGDCYTLLKSSTGEYAVSHVDKAGNRSVASGFDSFDSALCHLSNSVK